MPTEIGPQMHATAPQRRPRILYSWSSSVFHVPSALAQGKHLESPVFAQTGLRISRYQPNTEMAPHQHDEASLNIVVSGDFLERIGRDERTYTRGTASFCPAATTHSQTFGARGVRQIIFKPDDSWLDYLADCKARLEEAPHSSSATFRDLGDR